MSIILENYTEKQYLIKLHHILRLHLYNYIIIILYTKIKNKDYIDYKI